MARSDLERQAHDFATSLQTLLNKTVAKDARVVSVLRDKSTVAVGTGLDRDFQTKAVPLLSTSNRNRCFLEVLMHLYLEEVTGHLTTKNSYVGIAATADTDLNPLFHYDFERGKSGYTEAHLQVIANNAELDAMMLALCSNRDKKTMGELHFPVGGRRYRPALEDILEFLIDEQLVQPKLGWEAELARTRDGFRRIQLKAAVRRDAEAAAAELKSLGWHIGTPPPEVPLAKRWFARK